MEKSFGRWFEPAVIVAFVSLLFLVLLYAVDVKIDSVKTDIDGVKADIALLRSDVNRTFDRQSAEIKATDKKIDGLKTALFLEQSKVFRD